MFRALAAQWLRQQVGQTAGQTIRQAVRGAVQSEIEALAARQSDGTPHADATPQTLPRCDLAVLFALNQESGGLIDLLSGTVTTRCSAVVEHCGMLDNQRIVVGETGVGKEAAYRATLDLLETHRPPWLISAGFAGGLVPEIRAGHFVLASSVVDLAERAWAIPGSWGQPSGSVHVGKIITVDRLIRTTAEKADLAQRSGAIACEMETAGVLQACRERDTRCISVRIITDGLDDELPREIETIIEQRSLAQKVGAVTGAVFRRPSSVKDMWNLHERALVASDRLAKFIATLIPQLRA